MNQRELCYSPYKTSWLIERCGTYLLQKLAYVWQIIPLNKGLSFQYIRHLSRVRHNAKQMLQQKIFFIFFGQFEIVDGKSFK